MMETATKQFDDEVVQAATFWFVLGLCAFFEMGTPDAAPDFSPSADDCVEYALEIAFPILVWAPQEPTDWEAELDF